MSSQPEPSSQSAEPSQQTEAVTVSIPEGENADAGTPIRSRTEDGSVFTPAIGNYSIFRRHMIYDPLMIIFTILVFAGGAIGYFTKQSVISLVTGTIFAFFLAAGTFIEGTRKNQYLLMITLLVLGILMADRYRQKWAFMPSGLITLLSFLMLARHVYIFYLRRRNATT